MEAKASIRFKCTKYNQQWLVRTIKRCLRVRVQFLWKTTITAKRKCVRLSQMLFVERRVIYHNLRVWSWLRMNAGGVPNTCKSNEALPGNLRRNRKWLSGGRVSNAWVTCPVQGDNSRKRLLIPHTRTASHDAVWKTPVVWDGPASD